MIWLASVTLAKYYPFDHVVYSCVSFTPINGTLKERNFVQAEGRLLKLGSFCTTLYTEWSGVTVVVISTWFNELETFLVQPMAAINFIWLHVWTKCICLALFGEEKLEPVGGYSSCRHNRFHLSRSTCKKQKTILSGICCAVLGWWHCDIMISISAQIVYYISLMLSR